MYLVLTIVMLINVMFPSYDKSKDDIIVPNYDWTEDDVMVLGDVGWSENGSTGLTEEDNIAAILLTMIVPLNRYYSGKWGNTLREVIWAKNQYAQSTKDAIGNIDTPEWVYELARELLIYGSNVPDYVVYQSMQPNLGTVWKTIENGRKDEYFATNGGHKNEGQDWVIKTNKELYLQQCRERLMNKIREFLEMDKILEIMG